jgi:hypothetical protein
MQDGLPLIGTILVKDSIEHQIREVYVTCLNHTYLSVVNPETGCSTNYPFLNFQDFLNNNGFSLRESTATKYQFQRL